MMKARFCLLLTAFIWGSTFIAQRLATDAIGPLVFNSLRFILAAMALWLVLHWIKDTTPTHKAPFSIITAGLLVGFILFIGSALQQEGIAHTSAGKTAFITSLYIVMVPVFGLLCNQRLSYLAIVGILSALFGIGLLTLQAGFSISWADGLLLISTFFWTGHILLMNYLSPRFPCIRLTAWQFIFAAILNGIFSVFTETWSMSMIVITWIPLLYSGILSGAIGFTLQTVFQRIVPPTQVALILSLEMIFAALLGWFFLGENLTRRELIGVIFISLGVIAAQVPVPEKYTIAPLQIGDREPMVSTLHDYPTR